MANWYAVQTKSRQECVADRHLRNQAFRTFLPLLKTAKHYGGRWQPSVEPLFPGYIFVHLDIEQDNTSSIRSTRGVIGLVRHGVLLRPLPNALIEELMRAQRTSGESIDPTDIFKPGDEVTLIAGPMAGLKAIFKARNSQERVILMLNMLGSQARVSVSPHEIAPIR